MADLNSIVRQEVEKYEGASFNSRIMPVYDEAHQTYMIVSIGEPATKNPAIPIVMARIEGDHVIIEADNTDKPLVEALIQVGVPRDKITLAYMDESLPEPSS